MAVETTLNRKVYNGDGSTTAFPTTFQFLDETDLVVILTDVATGVETVKTINTHYTVSGGDGEMGTVTMLTAPTTYVADTSGEQLTIYNDPAITQGLDLIEDDVSPAETKEQAWDRLTYIAQRLSDRIDRSIRLSEGSVAVSLTLPAPSAGLALGWNDDEDEIVNLAAVGNLAVSSFAETLLDDANAAAMIATLTASLTEDTAPALGDFLATYDLSGTTGKKVLLGALIQGALEARGMYNLGLANATTTNAADSIKIQGAAAALSATNPLYINLPTVSSPGRVTRFSAVADVTINLTGAHWGMGTKGDFTDRILRVYAINDNGTLKWGVSNQGGKRSILDTNSHTTASSCATQVKMLVNSALTSGTWPCREVGWFLADFDDTGGAAEDLWAVQTGAGEIMVGVPAPVHTDWVPMTIPPSWTTNSPTYTGQKRQRGEIMEYEFQCAFGGVCSDNVTGFNLPTGDVIDTGKLLSATTNVRLDGNGYVFDASTDNYPAVPRYASATAVTLATLTATGATAPVDSINVNPSTNTPMTIANGDMFVMRVSLPLLGLSGN